MAVYLRCQNLVTRGYRHFFSKKIFVLILLNCLSPTLISAKSTGSIPIPAETYANLAMGGIVRLTMEGGETDRCRQVADRVFSGIRQMEMDVSHRNPFGSVGKINESAGKQSVEVSLFAYDIIERAVFLGKITGGIFDITIGAVTLEPFYYTRKIPSASAGLVDYKKIVLDPSTRKIKLPLADMAIDLGGLAKGSIVDAAADLMHKSWIPRGLVEAGGDVYCYGNKKWKIGIQDPRSENLLGVIHISNAGVCGSGDYYQYQDNEFQKGKQRRHHILDPTFLDSAHKTIGITVIAPTAELADALATTLFIAGPQDGLNLLKKFTDCSALWVLPDGSLVFSPGFPSFL